MLNNLIGKLEYNDAIKHNNGPWVAFVVLAVNPHQDDVPWEDLQWYLCISYRRLNKFMRPYALPIPRCNAAVKEINKKARYFISIDLELCYWQVEAKPEARSRLEFFNPSSKKCWTLMLVGALN